MARSRKRGRKGLPLWLALMCFAAMAAIGAAWWLLAHVLVLAGFAVIAGGVYLLGRHHEHRRPRMGQGQPREPQPVQNARSLAQQLRHARGQVETLTGKLADEMTRTDRSQL